MDATELADGISSLEDLPEDVLARIFGLLSAQQLSWVERVSRRCRVVVINHELWRQHCLLAHPAMAKATSVLPNASLVPCHRPNASHNAANSSSAGAAPTELQGGPALVPDVRAAVELATDTVQFSAFYKRLHYCLTAPMARDSLIAAPLAASSTDHPQERIRNVLNPTSRRGDVPSYWSSSGSMDADSSEVLTFRLAHPLCIVTELQLRPFKAYFQAGSPIYPPKAVRVCLGGLNCFPATDGSLRVDEVLCLAAACELSRSRQLLAGVQARSQDIAAITASSHSQAALQLAAVCLNERCQQQEWTWESPAYAVESQDVLQRFPIPPTLCVGGYLRVELLGRQQRQAGDEAYYTCVSHLRALGTPIHNFQLQPPQSDDVEPRTGWQLTYKPFDPLLAAGGLAAVAHRAQQAAGFEGVDAFDSDSDSWGSDVDPQDDAEIVWDDSGPDGYDSLDDDRYD